jgi:hypothetical protein
MIYSHAQMDYPVEPVLKVSNPILDLDSARDNGRSVVSNAGWLTKNRLLLAQHAAR